MRLRIAAALVGLVTGSQAFAADACDDALTALEYVRNSAMAGVGERWLAHYPCW